MSASVFTRVFASCWSVRPRPPDVITSARLREFGLWRPCRVLGPLCSFRVVPRRGQRSSTSRRQSPVASAVRSAAARRPISGRPVFACLNIQSLNNKFDDVIEFIRDNSIDVMCLTESWLDSDSVALLRLRAAGYNVVDRPRPRVRQDLSVNHGGILLASSFRMSVLPFASPSTFELLVVRVAFDHHPAAIIAVIYRPGSAPVQQRFFEDL